MENNFTIPQFGPIKDIVHSFWQTTRQNDVFLKETIIPKGVIEVIFNLYGNEQLQAQVNKEFVTVPRCFIQGFHTRPVQLHLAGNQTFFGVVLYPVVVQHIFHFQAVELMNSVIDITLIDDSFEALWYRLCEQKTFTGRVNIFTAWLAKRLPLLTDRERAFNKFFYACSNTTLSVSEVAKLFCYSPKQLSRKLQVLTGLNTELLLLYKKYLYAVQLMHFSKLSLTKVAYACHFFDQSHFIRTFKSFTMLTPKEYRRKKSGVMGHLFENVP